MLQYSCCYSHRISRYYSMVKDKKIVIFDLDGTLALIDKRRALATDIGTDKMDWDIFFDPDNISLDEPNIPVIKMAQLFAEDGFKIVIFSGINDLILYYQSKYFNRDIGSFFL